MLSGIFSSSSFLIKFGFVPLRAEKMTGRLVSRWWMKDVIKVSEDLRGDLQPEINPKQSRFLDLIDPLSRAINAN